MISKKVVKLIGCVLILYSIIQNSLFIIAYAQNLDPDWIVLFKVMNNFILLPSAALLNIAVSKDNMTVVAASEVMFFTTLLGFIFYTAVLLMTFVREKKYGLPFIVFLIQRSFFFGGLLAALVLVDRYRRMRRELLKHDRWVDAPPTPAKSLPVRSNSQFELIIEGSESTTDLDTAKLGADEIMIKGLPRPIAGLFPIPTECRPPVNINPLHEKKKKKVFKKNEEAPMMMEPPTIYIGPPMPPESFPGSPFGFPSPPGMQPISATSAPTFPSPTYPMGPPPMGPHPMLPMPPGTPFPTPYTQRAAMPIGCMEVPPPPLGHPMSQPFMPFSNPYGIPFPPRPGGGGCCG